MSSAAPDSLPKLPVELWSIISSHLPNRDIKSMRLACKQFHDAARLRLQRVFLSSNPLNIEVFRAIADHETFRHGVTEIVWDDARFLKGPRRFIYPPDEDDELITDDDKSENEAEIAPQWPDEDDDESDNMDEYPGPRREKNDTCPRWFRMACQENLELLSQRKGDDGDRPDHVAREEQIAAQPPLQKCWEYYQRLLRQQAQVLVANADENVFRHGLKQFSALKTVTITPAAHGYLFAPLYPSPMIRSFPKGCNYPIPRSWPMPPTYDTELPPLACSWRSLNETHKDKYRGFRIATRILAKESHNVSEFIIDVHQLPTGINCTILDNPCPEYDNLATILKKTTLRRLDLAFIVRGIERGDLNWRSFRNGKLYQALVEASDLEDFRFSTTAIGKDIWTMYGAGPIRHFIPLQSIFPVENWPKLRHFQLSQFLIMQSDLISLLCALPDTLCSVQLSDLVFLDDGGNWYDLTNEMRTLIQKQTLWPNRHIKVVLSISDHNLFGLGGFGRGTWLESEVHEFLYGTGQNPFYVPPMKGVEYGFGTEKDAFEPNHERPRVHWRVLREKGYIE